MLSNQQIFGGDSMKSSKFTKKALVMLTVVSLALCLGACSAPEQKAAKAPGESPAAAPQEAQQVEAVADVAPPDEEEVAAEPIAMEDIENSVIKIGEVVVDDAQGASSEAEDATKAKQLSQPDDSERWVVDGAPEQPEVRDPADFMPEKRPYAESPHAENIDKGLAWLAANEGQITCNWMDYFVLDYLQRKFGLDESYGAENLINLEKTDQDSKLLMALYARLVKDQYKLGDIEIPIAEVSLFAEYEAQENESLVTAATLKHLGVSLSGAMLRAMYCDLAAVDEEFVEELLRQIRETEFKGKPNNIGGYIVSHMALACKWMQENGCAEAFDSLKGIEEELATLLAAMVDDQQVVTDLGMEAIALMHYLGHSNMVKEEWAAAVAAAQMPEGCWDRQGGQSATPHPQGHPTVFALWALLEEALPDAAEIPWLR
jgi:hypothetical protein